jgi:predicted transglutaminase-like protease
MDLKKQIMTDYKSVSKHDRELYKSYMVHMGVYDAKKKKVMTIHYGVFGEMFYEELFDEQRTNEVYEAILKDCEWLSPSRKNT